VGGTDDSVTHRGKVGLHIATGHPEETVLATVAGLLEGDARHVLLFCRTDDRAADLGDYLTLHGYMAGAPGDTDVPVWLAVEELEAREAAEGVPGVVPVSADVPADPDSLDRRHGRSEAGEVIVLPREVEHFRNIAFRTGYTLARRAAPAPSRAVDEVAALRDAIERAVTEEDIAPYFLVLEPLFAKHDPMAVAAAATALFRRKAPVAATGTSTSSGASERDPAAGPAQQAWVRVFLGVGSRDEITPRDLVGAIAGESGIRGNQVGKIEIRDTVTIVEIEQSVAEKVIRAVNGTTIKGRSVRADYDRPRGREPRDGGGKRSGPPPRKKDPRGPR
ncbi:MAG: DbpA RNA binding domain-containing protein, partial [Gemmatimonadota bacterium]|nr:DbpA RNA binding domain-containing protein [Gemmatimonadota bacterium]